MEDGGNKQAIGAWSAMPREALAALDPEGGFGKQHMLNPVMFRMLGDVRGLRVLDAGCGQGYLSRMLADRGARVTGVEPADALYSYCLDKEREHARGIRYVKADLSRLPDIGGPFDAVVASMVFLDIPDWEAAMAHCVDVLRPDGLFVFSLEHPCWAPGASASWAEHGFVALREYFDEYKRKGPYATSFHRPLSRYLNAVIGLGCRLVEVAEPRLEPAVAAAGPVGAEACVHVPNYIVVAATRPAILPKTDPAVSPDPPG